MSLVITEIRINPAKEYNFYPTDHKDFLKFLQGSSQGYGKKKKKKKEALSHIAIGSIN